MNGKFVALLLLFLALVAMTGCATYSQKFKNLRPELAAGEFEAALQIVEKQSGSKDVLLYYLERGLILHYAERYGESNEAFAAAERTADELYTKSISEGIFSLSKTLPTTPTWHFFRCFSRVVRAPNSAKCLDGLDGRVGRAF